MNQKAPGRLVIYAKDIMIITGRRERTARKLLGRIKKQYRKRNEEMVSVDEFCTFTGLNKDDVNIVLQR